MRDLPYWINHAWLLLLFHYIHHRSLVLPRRLNWPIGRSSLTTLEFLPLKLILHLVSTVSSATLTGAGWPSFCKKRTYSLLWVCQMKCLNHVCTQCRLILNYSLPSQPLCTQTQTLTRITVSICIWVYECVYTHSLICVRAWAVTQHIVVLGHSTHYTHA